MTSSKFEEADLDVNIFDNPFDEPNIELAFPLPESNGRGIELDGNEKLSQDFGIINNFFYYVFGIKFNDIYKTNEYYHSYNKNNTRFNKKIADYMDNQLERSDKYLEDLVYDLIGKELSMKLILPDRLPERYKQVRQFMVNYYHSENEKNLPQYRSHFFIRIAYLTVIRVIRKLFPQGIWCSRVQLSELLKRYVEDPMSIIFLPNHQSHFDYIFLHVVCIRFGISTPSVVAGDNLNVAVFGRFLRNLGAIFIKRSFANESYTEQNLMNFMEFLFLNKIHLEVFIEGTRSRDGKLLNPKYGILKILTAILLRQREKFKNRKFDLLFQPVSITYERIYEADGYLKELLGGDKKQESMFAIFRNAGRGIFQTNDGLFDVNSLKTKKERQGYYDTTNRNLNGKIFIVLGKPFTLSNFIEKDKKEAHKLGISPYTFPNIKKLGMKVMHEINRVSYLPPVSVVGTAIQAHYYYHNQKETSIKSILPELRFVISILQREEERKGTPINIRSLSRMSKYSDQELQDLIVSLVPRFFRRIKINFEDQAVRVDHPMELLYYKNLVIHELIHRCLVCFVVSRVNDIKPELATFDVLKSSFILIITMLKNEFMIDYNYAPNDSFEYLLSDLVECGMIGEQDGKFFAVKECYVTMLANLVTPFVKSYILCINMLIYLFTRSSSQLDVTVTRNELVNNPMIETDIPETKTLLKNIQNSAPYQRFIEAINKQYLLSCLFYLDNLRLISIIRNKARTKAYVIMTREKDLNFLYQFLAALGHGDDPTFFSQENLNYASDIVFKNFDRGLPSRAVHKL